MSRPKYAGKRHPSTPAAAAQALVPADTVSPPVVQAIRDNPELAQLAGITAVHILQHWAALATVDVTEMVRVVNHACRYCHGIDHAYQWASETEWAAAVARAIEKGHEAPGCEGGFDYHPDRDPVPTCPHCFGKGNAEVEMTDYRTWSPQARMLYNGAKRTKYGIEILLRDRDRLIEMAGKHLGMFKTEIEHGGQGGGPIQFLLSAAEAAL